MEVDEDFEKSRDVTKIIGDVSMKSNFQISRNVYWKRVENQKFNG